MPEPGRLEARGDAQLSLPVRGELLERVRELARSNGRAMREEVEHALRRHLEAPPVVRVDVPALPPAEVVAEGANGRRRRRARS